MLGSKRPWILGSVSKPCRAFHDHLPNVYCRACQRLDWVSHKHECKAIVFMIAQLGRLPTPTILLVMRLLHKLNNKQLGWGELTRLHGHMKQRSRKNAAALKEMARIAIAGYMAGLMKPGESSNDTRCLDTDAVAELIAQVECNAFTVTDSLSSHGDAVGTALYLKEAVLLNHSCAPNCCAVFSCLDHELRAEVRCLQRVQPEEELTIGYTELARPTRMRRQCLQEGYYFFCTCVRCCRGGDAALDGWCMHSCALSSLACSSPCLPSTRQCPQGCGGVATIAGAGSGDQEEEARMGIRRYRQWVGMEGSSPDNQAICTKCGAADSLEKLQGLSSRVEEALLQASKLQTAAGGGSEGAGERLRAAREVLERALGAGKQGLIWYNWRMLEVLKHLTDGCVGEQDWGMALRYAEESLPLYREVYRFSGAFPLVGLQLARAGKLALLLGGDEAAAHDRVAEALSLLSVTHGESSTLCKQLRLQIGGG
ncbi:unnamed protein product [Chrysoparadoxa australica]